VYHAVTGRISRSIGGLLYDKRKNNQVFLALEHAVAACCVTMHAMKSKES
jgi:hypothetical protein